jgi:hypothetical protein
LRSCCPCPTPLFQLNLLFGAEEFKFFFFPISKFLFSLIRKKRTVEIGCLKKTCSFQKNRVFLEKEQRSFFSKKHLSSACINFCIFRDPCKKLLLDPFLFCTKSFRRDTQELSKKVLKIRQKVLATSFTYYLQVIQSTD